MYGDDHIGRFRECMSNFFRRNRHKSAAARFFHGRLKIKRAFRLFNGLARHAVCIDHGSPDVAMTEKCLDSPDIVIGLQKVATFSHKASSIRGIRLAFFVSVSGFTDNADRTLRNQASDPSRPLIVPITGTDIKNALIRKDDFEGFFKDAIRRMKHLRE
jgi:hypothetical protein